MWTKRFIAIKQSYKLKGKIKYYVVYNKTRLYDNSNFW
jgi:hypothetical protein